MVVRSSTAEFVSGDIIICGSSARVAGLRAQTVAKKRSGIAITVNPKTTEPSRVGFLMFLPPNTDVFAISMPIQARRR